MFFSFFSPVRQKEGGEGRSGRGPDRPSSNAPPRRSLNEGVSLGRAEVPPNATSCRERPLPSPTRWNLWRGQDVNLAGGEVHGHDGDGRHQGDRKHLSGQSLREKFDLGSLASTSSPMMPEWDQDTRQPGSTGSTPRTSSRAAASTAGRRRSSANLDDVDEVRTRTEGQREGGRAERGRAPPRGGPGQSEVAH